MSSLLLPAGPAEFARHPLHAAERSWTETNCSVDVWIEVLHALGLDPLAAAAFTLSADFEGYQWSFFKYPPEDLRALFGIEVVELNVWKPVVEHVAETLAIGQLCTVEADSYFLPDTREVSYGIAHVKSTIVPRELDVAGRRLGYFHNAGYFELDGADFDGVFRLGAHAGSAELPPYMELIRLDRLRRGDPGLVANVVDLARDHLTRRPETNPVTRLGQRLADDLPWLAEQGLETFHLYSFGTCRQCGACAELASSFVDWLDRHDRPGSAAAARSFAELAAGAKALQFALARAARGRRVDLAPVLQPMEQHWSQAMTTLLSRYGD